MTQQKIIDMTQQKIIDMTQQKIIDMTQQKIIDMKKNTRMDLAKFLLLMLYLLIAAWAYYILSRGDCKLAVYFIKIFLLLILFEALVVLAYESPCQALRQLCGEVPAGQCCSDRAAF